MVRSKMVTVQVSLFTVFAQITRCGGGPFSKPAYDLDIAGGLSV